MKHSRLRRGLTAILCLGTAACAPRPGDEILSPVAVENPGKVARITVATTRARASDDPDRFTAMRDESLNFERYDISIPTIHKAGNIEFPKAAAVDPGSAFAVTGAEQVDLASVRESLSAKANPTGEVAVFIHGYNTNYEEALFLAAQLKTDLAFNGVAIAFIWPSRGSAGDYLTDRDSATYSRDYLQRFLDEVGSTPGVRKIDVIAHSMGNWLAVEALRQAKLAGRSKFMAKLNRVLLMSPDIDVDVFRTQMEAIGRLDPPITVLTSGDDRALGISKRLSGGVPRLGDLPQSDPRLAELVRKFGLLIVDLSSFKGGDAFNHSKFQAALPEYKQIQAAAGNQQNPNNLTQPGDFVFDTGKLWGSPSY